jgi:hypothetical protein
MNHSLIVLRSADCEWLLLRNSWLVCVLFFVEMRTADSETQGFRDFHQRIMYPHESHSQNLLLDYDMEGQPNRVIFICVRTNNMTDVRNCEMGENTNFCVVKCSKFSKYICDRSQRTMCVVSSITMMSQATSSKALVNYSKILPTKYTTINIFEWAVPGGSGPYCVARRKTDF